MYLLTVSAAAFAIPSWFRPWGVAFFIAYQLMLLAVTGNLSRRTFFSVWKLKFLFLFLILGYSLLPDGTAAERWRPYPGSFLSVSFTGLYEAVLLSSQIALVVLTSHFVCSVSSPETLAKGLQQLWVSPMLAHAVSSTLAHLQSAEGGRGMGTGRGMGRNRRAQAAEESGPDAPSLWQRLQQLPSIVRGQASPLGEKLRRQLHTEENEPTPEGLSVQHAQDAKVIAGIAVVMLSLKAMKFLPGLPFASGHKTIVFIPLYLVAADRTNSRWGATAAGLVMGLVAFIGGDGRYGIFEVLKHLAPGVCIDLMWPLVHRWRRRYFMLTLVGVVAAAARVSTELALTLCLGLRWELYAFPIAKLFPNLVAGALSGLVSAPLLAYLAKPPEEEVDSSESRVDADADQEEPQVPPGELLVDPQEGPGRGDGSGGGRGGGGGRGDGSGGGRRRMQQDSTPCPDGPGKRFDRTSEISETTMSGEAETT